MFWKAVFEQEERYLATELSGCKTVLSVGCGPAAIEGLLLEYGFDVTGLDISQEALNQAPDGVRTILGSAEQTNIENASFDAIIYVASLQFMDDYGKALRESERVLRPAGIVLVMLLNPKSLFFEKKRKQPESYINKIKHPDIQSIQKTISELFCIEKAEFFLGIRGEEIFNSTDPRYASLYCIKARKKM
jgi:ubiquinone/menaquinone biosynthesis C-methylase UbiE